MIQTPNKAIKSVPGRWPSTGRPCQGAAYGWRYALKQMPLRQHAFVQDADNFNNTLGG
jgi:hypothetical protein